MKRKDGRVAECGGLENRCTARYRGFESPSFRQLITSGKRSKWTLSYPRKLEFLRSGDEASPTEAEFISINEDSSTQPAPLSRKNITSGGAFYA